MSKTFGQYLFEWLAKEKMSQNELARRLDKSPAYVNYLVRDMNPSSKTGKAVQPSRDVVDKIAVILNVPEAEAREAAKWAAEETGIREFDEQTERLLRYYSELPNECQSDALALIEALWKRRRIEGRAEKLAKSRAETSPFSAKPKPEKQDQPHSPRKRRTG